MDEESVVSFLGQGSAEISLTLAHLMHLPAAPRSAQGQPALPLVAVVNVALLGPAICEGVEDSTLGTSVSTFC